MTTMTLQPYIQLLKDSGFRINDTCLPRRKYRARTTHRTIKGLTCASTTTDRVGFWVFNKVVATVATTRLDDAWLTPVLIRAQNISDEMIALENKELAKEEEDDSAWLARRSAMAQILRNTHGCSVEWRASDGGCFRIVCRDRLPGRIVDRSSRDGWFAVTAIRNLDDQTIGGFEIGSIRVGTTAESPEAKAECLVNVLAAITDNA